jgi:hypothetical protein
VHGSPRILQAGVGGIVALAAVLLAAVVSGAALSLRRRRRAVPLGPRLLAGSVQRARGDA